MSSEIKEVDATYDKIPEGCPGNLTDKQEECLVEMWKSYFDICDRARGKKTKGEGFKEDTSGKDPKKSGIPQDDAAKDEAKKQSEQQGMNELLETYGSEALRDAFWQFVKFDNPDGVLLRFIRARKLDVGRAMAMMATTLRWRLDTDVESLIVNGDEVNGKEISKFTEQMKSGKVFALGCSSEVQPICYVIMKYHSVWGQPAASMQKFIISQMESFRLLMAPPVDKACIFFDLKGFGVKQMDVVSLLFLVKALESYYPESLSRMYVSNAPWIFNGFWKMVNPLLDPVVRNKIVFITGPKETGDHVPADTMITYCGGNNKAEFKYVDAKDGENDCQKDEKTKEKLRARHRKLADQFEKVTREWCEKGGRDDDLTEKRLILIKKLRLSQFDLEPYFRGLTAYHRDGTVPLENPGMASFLYDSNGEKSRQVMGKPNCRKSLERELCEIVDGSSCKEAEQKTKKMIEDGSWGQWRVNDNSPEIVKKAMASLEDLENTGKLNTEKAEPAAPAAQEQLQSISNGDAAAVNDDGDTDDGKNASDKAPNGSAAAAAAPTPKKKMSSSPSAKRMNKSSSATTDYGKEDGGAKSGGLLGSLKAKIGVN